MAPSRSYTAADSASACSSAGVPVRVADELLRLQARTVPASNAGIATLNGEIRFRDNMEPISTQRKSKYKRGSGAAGQRGSEAAGRRGGVGAGQRGRGVAGGAAAELA